jgi:hypothetical protein
MKYVSRKTLYSTAAVVAVAAAAGLTAAGSAAAD